MLVTMSDHRNPRGGRQARNFSARACCMVLALTILAGRGRVDAEAFRCEGEEDLNGSTCRVDMLPDTALAQMVYERGFDPEGANRLQLLDAVMQLLDYEEVTGEDLREMEYNPDDGSVVEEENTEAGNTALELNQAEVAEAGREICPESNEWDAEAVETSSPYSATGEEDVSEWERVTRDGLRREEASARAMDLTETSEMFEKLDESTLLGFAKDLGVEILTTMTRDLNAFLGLLPGPVAKPIREIAAGVRDTTVRFAVPMMKQAERYTRGLRRGATSVAGKVALRLRDDVCPRVARGVAAVLGKMKRRVSEAISRRDKEGLEEKGEAEDGHQHHESPQD